MHFGRERRLTTLQLGALVRDRLGFRLLVLIGEEQEW
jgi:hypothetical protein